MVDRFERSTGAESGQLDHPAHFSPAWRHIPLVRATADKPRGPRIGMARTLVGAPEETRRYAEMYWSGVEASWAQLVGAVDGGEDVGLLVERSGLVVVDCDVKNVDADGWVVVGGKAVRGEQQVVRGTDDLQREVERLGHCMAELRTYTVGTKSGGAHLYFGANPDYPLTNRHHRQEWRVDVIASENSWVAAPPSPGYRVLADCPVRVMPEWLAVFLYGLNGTLPALGGRVRAARAAAGEADGGPMRDGESLPERYARMRLDEVALSNRVGGWNMAIYRAVRDLLDTGWAVENVRAAVIQAAAPVDAVEERKADATISSAVRGHLRANADGWSGE